MDGDHHVGYTPNPGGRGTLDLLWSCIVTAAFCTWTVQKLQVGPRSSSAIMTLRRKAFWMLITLLCPEYVTWIAFAQWQRARRYKDICELGHNDWTMQHGFYVDMGGLQVDLEGSSPNHRFDKGNSNFQKLDNGVRYTIRLHDLVLLLKADVFPVPEIRLQDLKERSKNDHFARVVTTLQVLCFVVHSFGRLGSHLPISTLELSTLAYVCCAALIEYLWWNKPLDLRTTTVITLSPDKRLHFLSILRTLQFDTPEQDLAENQIGDFKFFFGRALDGDKMRKSAIHAVWIGCIFNGIHVSAWNFSFASDFEQLLWRITSVGACIAFTLTWAVTFLHPKLVGLTLAGLFTLIYSICRVYLILEIFVGLRSVPAALYQSVTWQSILPGV